jgi:hypothetical protein
MTDQPITVSFVQHFTPALQAGAYEVTLEQSIAGNELPSIARRFAISGERFAIAPGEIGGVFPPRGSAGDFERLLPHVVLTRQTLPWERCPEQGGHRVPTEGEASEGAQPDVPSWLAILLFDESEAPVARSVQLQDLVPKVTGGQLEDTTFSYGSSSKDLADFLENGQRDADSCTVIDLPLSRFQALAPSLDDLSWLAHGRSREHAGETQASAVVIGNRLPALGRPSVAHLVSLEGLGSVLHGNEVPEGIETIRLVSLLSWRFTAQPQPGRFADVLKGLSILFPRLLTGHDANAAVTSRLAQGYLPLHHRRANDFTSAAWYRGPLLLAPPENSAAPELKRSASQCIPDSSADVQDLSAASAWELGRLLALQNRGYATELHRWKRSLLAEAQVSACGHSLATSRDWVRALLEGHDVDLVTPGREATGQLMATARGDEFEAHLGEITVPASIASWLHGLAELRGVPFRYMVPRDELLPPESILFFAIDPSWIASLVDGAWALGRGTEAELARDQVIAEAVHEAAGLGRSLTGFLLRSRLVQGWWPGMQIDAYAAADASIGDSDALPKARFEALSPTVLLCLFDGTVRKLFVHEPPEGLHFGLDQDVKRGWEKQPRASDGSLEKGAVPLSFRGDRVVDVSALAAALEKRSDAKPFTSAEFALAMIEGVQSVSFTVDWNHG